METSAKLVGASLSNRIEWKRLNWRKLYRNVRRLQARIVKALKEGQKRKARALQFILTRSLAGKALAVRRVTENQGKRTAGVDGQNFYFILSVITRFIACDYQFQSRIHPTWMFERLEPDDGKLSSPVLRGGGDGNVASLPDVRHEVVRISVTTQQRM